MSERDDQVDVLARLRAANVITNDVADLFHGLRKVGNIAAHDVHGDPREALHQMRMARQLGIWFHRAFGAANPRRLRPARRAPRSRFQHMLHGMFDARRELP